MRVVDNYEEMLQHFSISTCAYMLDIINEFVDHGDCSIDRFSFTKLVGGPVYLIEHLDELGFIHPSELPHERRLSLLDAASAWFDIAEWTVDEQYVRFAVIANNEGGPQYFVPRAIAQKASNVARSIQLTAARNAG